MPKVSVFLTSYNHGKYIREAIDSVLAQTFTDFDLVIWDDASTDDSWQIIQTYDDPRIRAYRNAEPLKGGINYRNAIETGSLKGDYIAMHHSDDVWLPDKLEKQLAAFNANPDLGSVFTLAQPITENGKPLCDKENPYYSIFDQPNRTRHEWLRYFFEKSNALCHPSVLNKREVLAKYALPAYGLGALGDLDMWVRICLHEEIFIVQEKLTLFRVRDNQANSSAQTELNFNRHALNQFIIYEHYANITDFNDLVKIFPEAASFERGVHTNVQFVFAMICLTLVPNSQAILWGYTTLFRLLQDKDIATGLYQNYGFDYRKFSQISGLGGIFQPAFAQVHPHQAARKEGLTKNNFGKFHCPLCNTRFNEFLPFSACGALAKEVESSGFDAKALKMEFLNRENIFCPSCMGMDRERMVAEYLSRRIGKGFSDKSYRLVEFAPSRQLSSFIKHNFDLQHVTADLMMPGVDYKSDLTNMPEFPDSSVDAWISIHMLEHIEDDMAALKELKRILKPEGFGVLLAPVSLALKQSDEDPKASVDERWRRFGQDDHIRLYAKNDFVQRINTADFKLTQLGMNWFGHECFTKLGLPNRAILYVVEK